MGFKVLPVKFSDRSDAVYHLFFKEHQIRDSVPEKPQDRTLFIINIPPFIDAPCLKRLFRDCGRIQRIYFHKRPSISLPEDDGTSSFYPTAAPVQGFRVAYCVFSSAQSLQKAFSLSGDAASSPRVLSSEQHPVHTGLIRWQTEQNDAVCDEEALKKDTDKFMTEYDTRVAEDVKKARACEGQPDDQGWVLVTRHSRRPVARRSEGLEQRVYDKLKKKRKRQQLINLYNFQLKDSKREQLARLRQKFEEDKKSIAEMRLHRKFKPY